MPDQNSWKLKAISEKRITREFASKLISPVFSDTVSIISEKSLVLGAGRGTRSETVTCKNKNQQKVFPDFPVIAAGKKLFSLSPPLSLSLFLL